MMMAARSFINKNREQTCGQAADRRLKPLIRRLFLPPDHRFTSPPLIRFVRAAFLSWRCSQAAC